VTAATNSILDLEEAAACGWRAPEEAALGRSRLRAAEPGEAWLARYRSRGQKPPPVSRRLGAGTISAL
jgi:hypothetical protein